MQKTVHSVHLIPRNDGGPRSMTRMGFLLDSDNCIGCHACTVACKSEHDVPLGVNRTWVKYIETGTFPDVARKFNVMRCNQCDDAPCMDDLPDLRAVPGRQRRRRLPGRRLHRLQVVHERLPLRRALHQPRDQHRPQVQHVQSPARGGPRAVVSDRVPDRGDQDRRPRRPDAARSAGSSPETTWRFVRPSRTPSRRSSTAAPTRPRSTRPGPPSPTTG